MTPYDAIVLAGGGSMRLGTDKTRVMIGGMSVLDHVLAAVATARQRLVVGAEQTGLHAQHLRWLREDPPRSGPANSVACAAPCVGADRVVILAGDLPYVDAHTVARLLDPLSVADSAALCDADGRAQWLTVSVRTSALRDRIATRDHWDGASMHALLEPLAPVLVDALGDEAHDIDTPDDIPSQS